MFDQEVHHSSHDRNAVHLGYIPNICKLLLKYDLLYVVNNFFHNSRSIPLKTTIIIIIIYLVHSAL